MRKPTPHAFIVRALCVAACFTLCTALFVAPCRAGNAGEAAKRVYLDDSAPAFAPGAKLLRLYVCPLLGSDCMLLLHDGHSMLIDMGRKGDVPAIQAMLDQLGLDKIDIAFNTHPHDDHLGGMKQLLATTRFGRFITVFPKDYKGDAIVQRSAVKALGAAGVPIDTLADGDTIPFGDVRITVLRQASFRSPNALSAMLMIKYGDCSMLLCADVTGPAQLRFAQTYDLKADIFKYPHHGLDPVYAELLANISPEHALITHGYANTKSAQKQLTKAGVTFDFATWGVICVTSDGNIWRVEQEYNETGIITSQRYGL